jgi:hypothetical protein
MFEEPHLGLQFFSVRLEDSLLLGSASTTLEDHQKLMQSLKSKLDKHVRQTRPAAASPSRERVAYMAHNSDSESDKMAYSAFVTDNHDGGPPSYTVYPHPLGACTAIDSPPPQ